MSSFKKAASSGQDTILGTRPSPGNFTLLTSTGHPTLDALLGGGVAVGTIILVEEDEYGYYSDIVAKYFIAEGVLCKQKVFIGSRDVDLHQLIGSLPGRAVDGVEKDEADVSEGGAAADELKIAWRYQTSGPTDATTPRTSRRPHLDLSRPIPRQAIDQQGVRLWCGDQDGGSVETAVEGFVSNARHCVEAGGGTRREVARVVLLRLGSPQWQQPVAATLYRLRHSLRRRLAVGLVTLPSTAFHGDVEQWRHLSDVCVRLQSLGGTPLSSCPALKDYHGLMSVSKMAAINCLSGPPLPADLAFKLRRRRLLIERLSLPPELEDSQARGEEALSCSSNLNTHLDF